MLGRKRGKQMKAKELAEELMKYPELELAVIIDTPVNGILWVDEITRTCQLGCDTILIGFGKKDEQEEE